MFDFDVRDVGRRGRNGAAAAAEARHRIAALDVGSNSFHLLVVEVDARGNVVVLDRAKEMVRLGAATLRDGVIHTGAFARGMDALARLQARARTFDPHAIVAVGTSALREASNGWHFAETARESLGLPIRIVDGLEEARLVYLGARQALRLADRRVALLDVGGGSTEVIVGDDDACLFASSLRLGVLRLKDEWPCSDPPTARERELMADWSRAVLDETLRNARDLRFDFVALTSGTAHALGRLAGVDVATTGGPGAARLSLAAIRACEDRLCAVTARDRVRLLGIEPGRVDSIVPGAIILRTALELLGVEDAVLCTAALREGIVADCVQSRLGT